MRLKRMVAFHPVSRRNGVSANVMQTKRSAQTPVEKSYTTTDLRSES